MSGTFNILSIDGGGIRGIIPAVMLEKIDALIRRKTQRGLSDYFDMIAGTSTGAVIATGIAAGIDVSRLRNIYAKRGREIFPYRSRWSPSRLGLVARNGLSAPKYSSEPLKRVLREEIGGIPVADVDSQVHVLVPFYDTITRTTEFIKSYPTATHSTPQFGEVPLWEAALCSSSAPTYFPAHRLDVGTSRYSAIDGGVAANNPIACALADAKALAGDREIRILSLGTGSNTRKIPLSDAQEWGAVEWAVPIIDVLMDASLDVQAYVARTLLGEKNVKRIQFDLSTELQEQLGLERLNDDMDDASAENISSLAVAAEWCFGQHEAELESWV